MKRLKIIIISIVSILFVISILFIIVFIQKDRVTKENTQEYYIDEYLKENNIDKLDKVDYLYYELLKDHNFAIFNKEADRKEREKIYYYSSHQNEAILEMCKQPPNLYGIVLLYDIDREKGLLNCEPYEKIYFDDSTLKEDNFRKVITETNDCKNIYLISITQDPYVQRVGAKKIEEIDKYGNIKDTREKRLFDNEKNIRYNFDDLCLDGEKVDCAGWYGEYYGDDIAISKHFRDKYKNFLDLFIHYSPIEYNHISYSDLDIENQTATFEVDSVLECKKRTYEVKYILDDNKYLDDAFISMQSKDDINIDSDNSDRMAQTFYKNSNLNNINITENVKEKYIKNGSIFPEIDSLGYNFSFDRSKDMYDALRFEIDNKKYQIRKFKINDNWVYYLWYYLLDKNDNLDDVIYEKLPYDSSMTLEEVRDAYIRDYVKKN